MTRSATALMPLTSPAETAVVTADFGPILASGTTIVSVASVSMTVWPNTDFPSPDANALSRLLGAPQITASPTTGALQEAVAQMVGNLLPGVRYAIAVIANASDGTAPELWQYMVADYPGMSGS